jgi:spermidine/putrescine transport system permease protein
MNIKKLGRLSSPYLVWMVILVGIPLLLMGILSFMHTNGFNFVNGKFTLESWITLVSDASVKVAFNNSIFYALMATLISFLIGYPMAYIVARSSFSNKLVILVLSIIPMWSNSLLLNNAIGNLRSSGSFVNDLLKNVGIAFTWNIIGSKTAIIIGLVLTYLPFMILPIYTVIEKIDQSLLEASMDLGANRVRTFFKVTFPLSLKGVMTGVIMVFLPCFSGFAVQKILGKGTGNSVVIGSLISDYYNVNPNLVSTLSLVILFLIFGAMFLIGKVDKEGETLI